MGLRVLLHQHRTCCFTSQHSTTLWSGQKLVRKELGLRAQCGTLLSVSCCVWCLWGGWTVQVRECVWLRGVANCLLSVSCCVWCLWGGWTVQVRECVWLRGVACHKEREHRMAQLLWWLVNSFLFCVISVRWLLCLYSLSLCCSLCVCGLLLL